MEKRILTRASILQMRYLLEEEKISNKVYNNLKDKDKYPLCTICDDGTIILGKTKYHFINQLLSCQDKIPFESFALRVWDALVELSSGENSKALKKDLTIEIAKKAIVEGDYNGLVKKLVFSYEHICNKKKLVDETSEDAGSEASDIDEQVIEIINGNRCKRIALRDSIGDRFPFDLEYGLKGIRFRNGKIGK